MIDIETTKQRIDEIKKLAKSHDSESAHGREDDLWEEVLNAIANGAENYRELSELALTTKNIKFERWYS